MAQFFNNPKLQTHCRLCEQEPTHKAHPILDCQFTIKTWEKLKPHLETICRIPVTQDEMAFGLPGNTKQALLRNWVTFILRQNIMIQHGVAFYQPQVDNLSNFTKRFNKQIRREIFYHYYQALSTQKLQRFKATFTTTEATVVQLDARNNITRTLQIS